MKWLSVRRGDEPIIFSLPHAGTDIPAEFEKGLVSRWLSLKDTDWWLGQLYSFATTIGATVIRTSISRTVVDVNRDPSGISLYPGQATTELCPTVTFDGEPLYHPGQEPTPEDIGIRRKQYFEPYHEALNSEINRFRATFPRIILYDCHSIRSSIPRLFNGTLPHFNLGTNGGLSSSQHLQYEVERLFAESGFSHITNGRFKGGYITRKHGRPDANVHALQVELACRAYMREPDDVNASTWPSPYEEETSAKVRLTLIAVASRCLSFAKNGY